MKDQEKPILVTDENFDENRVEIERIFNSVDQTIHWSSKGPLKGPLKEQMYDHYRRFILEEKNRPYAFLELCVIDDKPLLRIFWPISSLYFIFFRSATLK